MANLALTVVVARETTQDNFGRFALVFAIYVVMLGICRSLTGEVFIILHTVRGDARATSGAAGSVVLIGLVFSCILIAAGLLARTTGFGSLLFGMAVVIVGVLLQDFWRYTFFAHSDAHLALMNDLLAFGLLIGCAVALKETGRISPFSMLIAWGATASFAGLVGAIQAHSAPDPRRSMSWLHRTGHLGPRYVGDFLALNASGQAAVYAVALFAGVGAAGAFRGGQVLVSPIYIVFAGLNGVSVAHAARLRSQGGSIREFARRLSVIACVSSAIWGLGIWLLPASLGRLMLGSSWPAAHSVLPFLTIAAVAGGATLGAAVALRALAAAGRTLATRAITSPLAVLFSAVGALLFGAQGAAAGLALALIMAVPLWWSQVAQSNTVGSAPIPAGRTDAPA